MDGNASSLLVMFDLSAAVDTIDHNLHLHLLNHYFGIKGSPHCWLRCSLTNRTQLEKSKQCNLSFGWPKGPWSTADLCYVDDTQMYFLLIQTTLPSLQKVEPCPIALKDGCSKTTCC